MNDAHRYRNRTDGLIADPTLLQLSRKGMVAITSSKRVLVTEVGIDCLDGTDRRFGDHSSPAKAYKDDIAVAAVVACEFHDPLQQARLVAALARNGAQNR